MGCRQLAQYRFVVSHGGQHSQIMGARLILARQTSGLYKTRVSHARQYGSLIHALNKRLHTAWESAAECVRRTVFTGHQGQVYQLTTA